MNAAQVGEAPGRFALMSFYGPADPAIACTGSHSALYLDTPADVELALITRATAIA